ncbi:MAG: hypothetical protein ACQETH_08310 [Candidatus Rifleibacteriota bacterium]
MIDSERFVLPFKWRDFGNWFSTLGSIKEKNNTEIEIKDIFFEASETRLEGIRIITSLKPADNFPDSVFLITFLADMETLELFEPFIGSPDHIADFALSGRFVNLSDGKEEKTELFIPDQGWILPSIWRFLVQSVGLKRKTETKMPEIIVFGFSKQDKQKPLFFARKPFDYFGNARRLKEELALRDFFRLLQVSPNAAKSDVERAYVSRCRELQNAAPAKFPKSISRRRNSIFARMKNGYQVWTEKLRANQKS